MAVVELERRPEGPERPRSGPELARASLLAAVSRKI
jgi:hypothetical protein